MEQILLAQGGYDCVFLQVGGFDPDIYDASGSLMVIHCLTDFFWSMLG